MIITMTPNPSLDQTVTLEELVRGEVLRARESHLHPGGKGVNVSRALAAHGNKTTALLCTGGAHGGQVVDLLDAEGINAVRVDVAGDTRANISIAEPGGVVTKLNLPGPEWAGGEVELLLDALRAARTADTTWVAGCGSLPPAAPTDTFARLVTAAHDAGIRAAIDTSGEALARALEAGPDLIKPNREELAESTGLAVATLGDAVRAAAALRERGAETVLTSLGADGALLVDANGVLHGEATALRPKSSVGAGDALLAGFLAATCGSEAPSGNRTRGHALANGLAWGTAAVQLEGSRMPHASDVEHIDVTIHPDVHTDRILR